MNQVRRASFLFSLMVASASFAEGVGSSGGGSGIVLKTGEVILAELAKQRNIQPEQIATHEEIQKMFFTQNRYVKKIATHDEHFFDCAIPKIRTQGLSFQNQWIEGLNQVRVLRVEMQLAKGASPEALKTQAFPRASDSSSAFPIDQQVALASYSKEDLWVQARLSNAMSDESECGLAVHEALRHLNNSIAVDWPLSTDEIEAITQELMRNEVSQTLAQKVKIGKIDHMLLIEDLGRQFSRFYNQHKKDMPGGMDFLNLYTDSFLLQQLIGGVTIGDADIRSSFTGRLLKFLETLVNYVENNKQELSAEQLKGLRGLVEGYYEQAEYLVSHNFLTPMDEMASSGNYVDRIMMGAALTKKLPGSQRFDVLLNQIVK